MRVKHVLISLGLVAFLGGAGFVAAKGYDLWQAEQRIEKAIKNIDVLSADQLVTDRVVAGFVYSLSHPNFYPGFTYGDDDLVEEHLCEPVFGSTLLRQNDILTPPTLCEAVFSVAEGNAGLFTFGPDARVAGAYRLLAPKADAFRKALRYRMWTVLGVDPDVVWAFYQSKKPSIIKAVQALPSERQASFVEHLERIKMLVEKYRQSDLRRAVNGFYADQNFYTQDQRDSVRAAHEKIRNDWGQYGIGGFAELYFSINDTLVDEYQRIAADLHATLTEQK